MEKKVQIALCALLFINLGSIVRGLESTPPPVPSESTNSEKSDPNTGQPPSSSGSEAAGSMPGITLDSLKPQANTSISSSESNNASSSGNNSNTEAEPASLTPTIPGHSDHYSSTSSPPNTPNGNVTITSATMDMDLPEIPSFPGNNTSFTEQSQPHTTLAPSENPNATTTHISHSSTTITHTVLPASKQTHITTPPPTTAPHLASSHTPTHQTSASSHATHSVAHHPKTTIPTSAPTTESPDKLHPNIEADVTTAIRIQSSSTSSTHQETPIAPVTSLPTPQSDSHPEIPSPTRPKSTISTPSSSSGQAKPHVDSPSQLNMGGAATVVHESATPDPLLAGLVSAFIITAVIITLLLFLKLRRRDNRPEFRRLQDLPMDDMMEDTPLSMYSY